MFIIIIIMIKVFFITFFISELIIALAIIFKIRSFNKKVNQLNKIIESSQNDLKELFFDIRFLLETFNDSIQKLKNFIRQKKEEYIINISKKILIIIGFLSLKGKYKKMLIAYELGKEIYTEFKEE